MKPLALELMTIGSWRNLHGDEMLLHRNGNLFTRIRDGMWVHESGKWSLGRAERLALGWGWQRQDQFASA